MLETLKQGMKGIDFSQTELTESDKKLEMEGQSIIESIENMKKRLEENESKSEDWKPKYEEVIERRMKLIPKKKQVVQDANSEETIITKLLEKDKNTVDRIYKKPVMSKALVNEKETVAMKLKEDHFEKEEQKEVMIETPKIEATIEKKDLFWAVPLKEKPVYKVTLEVSHLFNILSLK